MNSAAWTTVDSRFTPTVSSIPEDQVFHEESYVMAESESDDDDASTKHIPKPSEDDWFDTYMSGECSNPSRAAPSKDTFRSWLTEERPHTPEPSWSILETDTMIPDNNWASTISTNYETPDEDSLLHVTGDMGNFINWFCEQKGISSITPKDLEGQAFEIVKVFHSDANQL